MTMCLFQYKYLLKYYADLILIFYSFLSLSYKSQCSNIFVTCSYETLRVWHLNSSQELLRIEIPNMACNSLFVMRDGRSIISGMLIFIVFRFHFYFVQMFVMLLSFYMFSNTFIFGYHNFQNKTEQTLRIQYSKWQN